MRILLVMALTAAASAWAGVGQWTSLGGPEGGNIAMLAIDPNTAGTIYAASNGGPTFKSSDGGTRWTVTDFPIGRLIIDPKDSQTLYVVTPRRGFFKSSDGGATWRDANSGLPGLSSSLEFDPQNPKTLYTGVGRQIFKSADGAGSWIAFSSLPPDAREYTVSLAIDPQDPTTLYAAQSGFSELDTPRFYRSSDGGANWTRIPAADNLLSFGTLMIDPKSPNTLYAGACSGFSLDDCDDLTIFKSMDRGDSWKRADSGLPRGNNFLVAMDPQNPATLYARGERLFRTMDGGATWSEVITGLGAYNVSNLAIDPQNAGTLYAGTGSGILKSMDAGVNWMQANTGLSATVISSMVVDAASPGTLYAIDNEFAGSLFKSTDGGTSWASLSSGLQGSRIRKLIVDPGDSSILYATMLTSSFQPYGTVFKSTDGGASWSPANSGLPGLTRDIALDPLNQGTVYASSYEVGEIGLGIYKTTDGAISWRYVGPGLMIGGLQRPASLMVDPQHPKTIYALYFGQGIWKSMDGGATFDAINTGLPRSPGFPPGDVPTAAFATDPQDSSILYVWIETCRESAAILPFSSFTCANGGLFKSTNGGADWEQAGPPLPGGENGAVLVIDPRNSSTMYTLSGGGDVFQSKDGGANWTPLSSGQTTQWFTTLAMDPWNPNTLYGTQGGGVFAITLID